VKQKGTSVVFRKKVELCEESMEYALFRASAIFPHGREI
jgi:hypothetical protein